MPEKRVLFLPINVLSSVTRQIMCARAFREKGYSVYFAGYGNYLALAEKEGFPVRELVSLDPRRLVERLRTMDKRFSSFLQFARWAWREVDLEFFVREEVDLLRELKPRVVISEERITAVLSARIAGVAHASLRNAYRTPYSLFPLLDLSGTFLGRMIPDPGQAQVRLLKFFSTPFLWRMNRVLRSHGLRQTLGFDDYIGLDDIVFLCDVPEFSPAGILPRHYHYVGPIYWKNGGDRPAWIEELDVAQRLVYVSLGSTGTPELLRVIIHALKGGEYALVVTGGESLAGESPGPVEPGVFVEKFLDPEPILQRAWAVLCHAGNGTIYQALASGVPVIGIPTHLEQSFNAGRLEALGLGRELDLQLLKNVPELLLQSLEGLRNDRYLRESVRRFQRRILSFNAPERITELTEAFLL
jgi:UDP:flavonoid glycosyltransferase YjiC (YdhE family)